MNYILKDDGTFSKVKVLNQKSIKDIEFCLVDISTDRKGPLYTLVKNPVCDFDGKIFDIKMDITYAPLDIPYDDTTMISSSIKIDSIEKYYNVYPLLHQMFGFNSFRDNLDEIDNHIHIDEVIISHNNQEIGIYSDSASTKGFRKVFKSINMVTDVNRVLNNKYIILIDNKWKIVRKADIKYLEFDKILIPVDFTESMYMLSYKEYILFNKVKSLSIELQYSFPPTIYSDGCRIIEETNDSEFSNGVYISSFDALLEAFMYMPQLLLLEQTIYEPKINLLLTLETKKYEIPLLITDDELEDPKNTCFYKIIKKLLKM